MDVGLLWVTANAEEAAVPIIVWGHVTILAITMTYYIWLEYQAARPRPQHRPNPARVAHLLWAVASQKRS
jgi:hypothetical protein